MKRILPILIRGMALASLAFAPVPVSAQDMGLGTAQNLSSNIHMVMSGGYWSLGPDEGFFRVVVTGGGAEHVSHRLFIQWVKTDQATQSYIPVRTLGVKELNLGHGYVLNVKTSFGELNAFLIHVDANSRSGGTQRFLVTARNDGTYSIRPK